MTIAFTIKVLTFDFNTKSYNLCLNNKSYDLCLNNKSYDLCLHNKSFNNCLCNISHLYSACGTNISNDTWQLLDVSSILFMTNNIASIQIFDNKNILLVFHILIFLNSMLIYHNNIF